MQLFLYKKSRKGLFGSSSEASVPDFRLRKSEKMPSSNFLEFFTGRPKAWKRKERHRTISVPEMWNRLFLGRVSKLGAFHSEVVKLLTGLAYHRTHDTYSPVGSKNLRMYCSGVQSTGAEMRKYLTAGKVSQALSISVCSIGGDNTTQCGCSGCWSHSRLSTWFRATCAS